MINYTVTITGKTALLMHRDNIEFADHMEEWKNNPENKKISKAGDDRTPAWRWIGCLYDDEKIITIPQGNIMRSLMEGGAMVPVPGGKSGKTFKAQTQSGMMCVKPHWALTTRYGNTVSYADIKSLENVNDFAAHQATVKKLGFALLVKRAKIGNSKHIRVRPQFDAGWSLTGTISVWDDQITRPILEQILFYAGTYKGLGDWRPGAKTPGPYGTFTAEIKG